MKKRVLYTTIISTLLIIAFTFVYLKTYYSHNDPIHQAINASSITNNTIKIEPKPIIITLSKAGKIQPGRIVHTSSPLSGKVKEIFSSYGQIVMQDQPILEIDSQEGRELYHEARKTYTAAMQQKEEILNWKNNREVVSAERSVRKAHLALEAQKMELQNTEMLYHKDIIDRNEYESAKQTCINQQMDLQSAEDELRTLRTKFTDENRTQVIREMQFAKSHMEEIENLLTKSVVLAPVTGMILKTPQSGGNESVSGRRIEKGVHLQQGEQLFSIGDISFLVVSVQINEVDITKIRIGQDVKITGDGFNGMELTGKISAIAPFATGDLSDLEIIPNFEVIITVDPLTLEQTNIVRVGMSANVEVIIYEKQEAILVPLSAVGSQNDRFFVTLKDGRKVEVKVGYTTAIGEVEIVAGVNAGEEIWTKFQE